MMPGFRMGVGGRSKAGSTLFDRTTLSLTGFWRGDFTASPWTGQASGGTSGGRTLTEGTNPPAASSGAADFDGTNDQLFSADAMSTFISAGAGTVWVLFWAATFPAAAGFVYNNPALFSDPAQGYIGAFVAATGGPGTESAIAYIDSSGVKSVTLGANTGAWNLFQMRWDGSDLEARINHGAWSSTACGNVGSVTGLLCLGKNYSSAAFYDGRIREIALMQSTISDSDSDGVIDDIEDEYGLAL